jgi:ADP-ribose pyrophosphatase YjhB (NUDIX family)
VRRRDNQHWEPPGGVLELAETFDQGVRREVFEETGIRVRVERLSGVYKNMPRGIVALVFRCSPVGGSSSASDSCSRHPRGAGDSSTHTVGLSNPTVWPGRGWPWAYWPGVMGAPLDAVS